MATGRNYVIRPQEPHQWGLVSHWWKDEYRPDPDMMAKTGLVLLEDSKELIAVWWFFDVSSQVACIDNIAWNPEAKNRDVKDGFAVLLKALMDYLQMHGCKVLHAITWHPFLVRLAQEQGFLIDEKKWTSMSLPLNVLPET